MAPINSVKNIIKKINIIVKTIIKITNNGFTILIPDTIPTKYPIEIREIRLNIRVMIKPKKSSIILFDFCIFGAIVPM